MRRGGMIGLLLFCAVLRAESRLVSVVDEGFCGYAAVSGGIYKEQLCELAAETLDKVSGASEVEADQEGTGEVGILRPATH